MATKTKKEEVTTTYTGTVSIEFKVKELLMKKAHSLFEHEPRPGFVGANLETLTVEIINLFN